MSSPHISSCHCCLSLSAAVWGFAVFCPRHHRHLPLGGLQSLGAAWVSPVWNHLSLDSAPIWSCTDYRPCQNRLPQVPSSSSPIGLSFRPVVKNYLRKKQKKKLLLIFYWILLLTLPLQCTCSCLGSQRSGRPAQLLSAKCLSFNASPPPIFFSHLLIFLSVVEKPVTEKKPRDESVTAPWNGLAPVSRAPAPWFVVSTVLNK